MFKNVKLLIFLLISVISTQIVLASPIHLSRADCVNNETLTWDPLYRGFTASLSTKHYLNGQLQHVASVGFTYNIWRVALVHWGESALQNGDWYVFGTHMTKNSSGVIRRWITPTTDCFSTAYEIGFW